MPEEVAFFGRTSVYGLLLAAVYWFVSYDVSGTVLLAGFGLATGVGFLALLGRHRAAVAAGRTVAAGEAPLREDAPFTDESGPVPLRSFAPLEVGIGIATAGLGLVFGIWFVIVAAFPLAVGSAGWVRAARREHDLVARRSSLGETRPGR